MGYILTNQKSQKRKVSKKEKDRIKEQKEMAAKVVTDRNNYWKTAKEYKPTIKIPDRNSHLEIHNGPTHQPINTVTDKIEYEGEMLIRELNAQKVTETLKNCSAPLYNKGAYQPVWTKDDALLIGRK